MEREAFVKVDSKIIAEGSELKTGAVSYGDKLRAEFKLKDEDIYGDLYEIVVGTKRGRTSEKEKIYRRES